MTLVGGTRDAHTAPKSVPHAPPRPGAIHIEWKMLLEYLEARELVRHTRCHAEAAK